MVVEVANRDQVIAHMSDRGIATGIHYPLPLHLQKCYASLGHKSGDFPVSENKFINNNNINGLNYNIALKNGTIHNMNAMIMENNEGQWK